MFQFDPWSRQRSNNTDPIDAPMTNNQYRCQQLIQETVLADWLLMTFDFLTTQAKGIYQLKEEIKGFAIKAFSKTETIGCI
jgi:hypothetical protein